jgi:nucleotide-binding universal stress UspA family protein
MFKTIVVGVDGREGGRDALSLAGRLALTAGGELIAVRVLPFDYYVSRAGSPPYSSIAETDARAEMQSELEQAGLDASIHVLGDSSPARALHRVAEAENADLIVVGSTHHGRAGRVFAGDDAAATIHGAPCPVAVAPRGLASGEWKPVKRIGVGYDGRAEARQALDLGVGLARETGATLRLAIVVSSPIADAEAEAYDPDWLARMEAMAKEDLTEAMEGINVPIEGQVAVGVPVSELVALSREVDLLVVGSRCWGPVRRILVGSTAARLVREAHCPVLVLPRGAATGQPGERDPGTVAEEPTAA